MSHRHRLGKQVVCPRTGLQRINGQLLSSQVAKGVSFAFNIVSEVFEVLMSDLDCASQIFGGSKGAFHRMSRMNRGDPCPMNLYIFEEFKEIWVKHRQRVGKVQEVTEDACRYLP